MDRSIVELLIAALYRTLLLREPEPTGLLANVENFLKHGLSFEQAIVGCLRCLEFSSKVPLFLQQYVDPERLPFTNDVSQHGEVGFLIRELVNEGATHRFLVDVGARGRARSNSYDLLARFGWKGLLIEANARLMSEIVEEFKGTEATILNYAISDYVGESEFFFGINDDVSSLSRQAVEGWGDLLGKTRVKVERLGNLLVKHEVPDNFDLLSLDIEGEDIKVLNDLVDHFPYQPKFIIIEVPPGPVEDLGALPFSTKILENYSLRKRVGPNLILRRR